MNRRIDTAIGLAIIIVAPIFVLFAMKTYAESLPQTQCFSLDGGAECPSSDPSTFAMVVFFLILFFAGVLGAAFVRSKSLLTVTALIGLPLCLVSLLFLYYWFWPGSSLWEIGFYLLPEVLGIIAGSTVLLRETPNRSKAP
ncbi:MAG: hypothetical protein WBW04_16865 [Nitrolancea sp.]